MILGAILGLSIIVPLVSASPDALGATPLALLSLHHLFGTDSLGRDVFVRTWAAGRVDLLVAALGSTVPLIVGTALGIAAGFTQRRWLDTLLMRFTDGVIAFPFVILALTLVLVLGTSSGFGPLPPGIPATLIAIWLVNWTIFARLSRAETLILRDQDFITAARLLGYSWWRITWRHLLPSVVRRTSAYAVNNTVLIVGTTASLAFLGAGAQPPAAEWGAMMLDGQALLPTAWWITVFPAIALALTVIGLSLVAEGIGDRDA